jgi:mannosyltransferase
LGRRWRAAAYALVLISFALRVYRLDAQSLWGDEGWAIYHADQSTVLGVLMDTYQAGNNPPLYYLALRSWMQATGQSEFALRYLSLIFGVVTVPAVFVLGSRLVSTQVGLVGALLQAFSPFHVYYSQEVRMYAPMVLFSVLASYFFWRLFRAKGTWPWASWWSYGVTGALAVYSHVFATPVLLAHALVWVGRLLLRGRSSGRAAAVRCGSAQVLALLLFSPWLLFLGERLFTLSGQVERLGVSLSTILVRCFSDFSAGVPVLTSEPINVPLSVALPFLVFLVLAFVWRGSQSSAAFLGTCTFLPVLSIFAISFPTLHGWTRYFSAASPHFTLLLALGVDGFRRFVGSQVGPGTLAVKASLAATVLSVSSIGLAQARGLQRYYTEETYWRWDFRGQVATMTEAVRQGAALVYNGLTPPLLFRYYLPDNAPFTVVPSTCRADDQRMRNEITAIASEHDKIWLMREMPLSCDENHRVSLWLRENAHLVSETWLDNAVFNLYLTPSHMSVYQAPAQEANSAVRISFGHQFRLEEYALNRRWLGVGNELAVAFRWRVLAEPDQDYKFFVVLLGSADEVVSLRDGMPANWTRPTTSWTDDEVVEDRWGMGIGTGIAPGGYGLFVGAYDPGSGERVPVLSEDGIVLGDKLLVAEVQVR